MEVFVKNVIKSAETELKYDIEVHVYTWVAFTKGVKTHQIYGYTKWGIEIFAVIKKIYNLFARGGGLITEYS